MTNSTSLQHIAPSKSASSPVNTKVVVPAPLVDVDIPAQELLQASVCVVAADPDVCSIRRCLATEGFLHVLAGNASAVRSNADWFPPDLLLLDGTQAFADDCRLLREFRGREFQYPIVLLLSPGNLLGLPHALKLGVTDFVNMPLNPQELVIRVRNVLTSKLYRDRLLNRAEELDRQVKRQTADLTAARADLVHCLARAAEYRDDDTGLHVVRVGRYVGLIARALGLPECFVDLLELAAQLHDIGKIGISDEILQKPGPLDPEEYERMQHHAAIGHQIIQPIKPRDWDLLKSHTRLGGSLLQVSSSPLLVIASRIAQTHHERWDGSGYPLGLAGEDIPIEGRITAVADVYDALSSKRPYKKPYPREVCFRLLEEGRGTHFDPHVLDAFFSCRDEIVNVQLDCMDPVR